jgi:hypothetical protein
MAIAQCWRAWEAAVANARPKGMMKIVSAPKAKVGKTPSAKVTKPSRMKMSKMPKVKK